MYLLSGCWLNLNELAYDVKLSNVVSQLNFAFLENIIITC